MMHDYLKVEFWDRVTKTLVKVAPEQKIRRAIAEYLRDLAGHDAEEAVYHFGEEDAVEAIRQRLSPSVRNSATTRKPRTTARMSAKKAADC